MSQTAQIYEFFDGNDRFGVSLPDSKPNEFQLVMLNAQKNERLVVCLPRHLRIALAMKILEADGAHVRVSVTYPQPKRPKKAKKKARGS